MIYMYETFMIYDCTFHRSSIVILTLFYLQRNMLAQYSSARMAYSRLLREQTIIHPTVFVSLTLKKTVINVKL